MYQHFEVTTPGIRLLQEATDKALDAATGGAEAAATAARRIKSRRSSKKQRSSKALTPSGDTYASGNSRKVTTAAGGAGAAAGDAIDPEAGGVLQQGGDDSIEELIDWQELQLKLEERSWSGWFSSAAGRCGVKGLQQALSQREVSTLNLGSIVLLHVQGGEFVPGLDPTGWTWKCLVCMHADKPQRHAHMQC
jgi:hypothetical protein